MTDPYSIVKSPVVTEKATAAVAEGNKYIFWVDTRANKSDIQKAVEKIFKVKVLGVNTQKVPGKIKRMGKNSGKRPTRKKAYITLKEGDRIEVFEGV